MAETKVIASMGSHRLAGRSADVALANRFLKHLETRAFSPKTVRAYCFDLLNFFRFLAALRLRLADVMPSDLFDYLDWQRGQKPPSHTNVVSMREYLGPAPATMNRRIAAVRGLFEFMVQVGARAENPVPVARRASGLREKPRGLLGHLGRRHKRTGGRLVREPKRLPESLSPTEVAGFVADLLTHRDRAMALAMLLGGLRAGEVRSLRLADVDLGLRQVRVCGKGNRERVVPIDGAFFAELAAYLRTERPPGLATKQCFVVLRGPTAGQPLTEDGLRKIFRRHRDRSGQVRVRPHRLRHTYGTELAQAGIDLVVLMDLMGHSSPETTNLYIHLSPEKLAREYEAARRRIEAERGAR
jgi:site-specific recombinase XerD